MGRTRLQPALITVGSRKAPAATVDGGQGAKSDQEDKTGCTDKESGWCGGEADVTQGPRQPAVGERLVSGDLPCRLSLAGAARKKRAVDRRSVSEERWWSLVAETDDVAAPDPTGDNQGEKQESPGCLLETGANVIDVIVRWRQRYAPVAKMAARRCARASESLDDERDRQGAKRIVEVRGNSGTQAS